MATAQLGLGMAALGRPGYITLGHGRDVGADPSPDAMERRSHLVLDAAFSGGIRWFDAARSYGRAETFLAGWLGAREIAPGAVTVSSKWGYRYTADWQIVAPALRVAKQAGLRVLVKEALANGRLTTGVAPPLLRDEAARRGVGVDALALAAALAQPFVDVVLSGAVTVEQLTENLRATAVNGVDLADAT